MNESEDNIYTCEECNNTVKEDDDFCPYCGSLFIDETFCENHTEIKAEGVCIICCNPYCKICGSKVNNHFLCKEHSGYEIYEGMARVHGSLDDTSAQYLKSCLEQEGLHPVLLSRHSPFGGRRQAPLLFETMGDFSGHIANEIKIMVLCQEVLKAEEIIKTLNTSD